MSQINVEIEDTPELMASRKNDHIRICQTENIESQAESFKDIRFIPEALPEMDFSAVDCSQDFLSNKFSMPLLITGMTGGINHGQHINEVLAKAAEEFSIPMGLGSQKIMIKSPEHENLFNLRKVAPKLFIIGNIGAVSFNYGIKIADIERLVDKLQLNAFAIHLNALQECIQPEGEKNFANLLNYIESLCKSLPVPVIVKEVGSGISASTLEKLIQVGVSAVDLGGRGGTSWSAIEGYRAKDIGKRLGELFKNWGYSTEESLFNCTQCLSRLKLCYPLIATGGIRDGLQVAKAIALGARMVGVGLPLFKAAVSHQSQAIALENIRAELNFFKKSLQISMFCSGAKSLSDLPSKIVNSK